MTLDMPSDAPISLKNQRWHTRPHDPSLAQTYRSAGIHPEAAKILSGRDLGGISIADFLEPRLRNLMPDPYRFKDMEAGAKHLAARIRTKTRIGIWSDYDADGGTSGAILVRFLRMVGAGQAPLRIPDRIREGYGPNAPGLLEMHSDGCETVCVLDAGTTAFEPLKAACEAGLHVIVVDHHAAEETLPAAVAVINPNRKDEQPGYGHLCAAGMTFIFCVAVARELKRDGYFDGRDGRPVNIPDLMLLLDLVALGTVCDVVPLTGLNRAFVAQGLKIMGKRGNIGLVALSQVCGLAPDAVITSADCGWKFGPRINSGGRISDSTLGARCLMTEDASEAMDLARTLEDCNTERKSLEAQATKQALEQLEGRTDTQERRLAFAIVEGHEGVVGISAARLKDALGAPAIVVTADHEGNLKGSARSVPGFDIGHAIIAARQAGLIIKGGGHGMAGGLTLKPDQVEAFCAYMDARIAQSDFSDTGVVSEADIEMRVPDLRVENIEAISQLEPFGTANPEPVVIIKSAELREIKVLAGKHFKLILAEGSAEIEALIWNVVETALEEKIRALQGSLVDVLGKPGVNEFRGNKKPQIMLDDIRPAEGALF